MQFKYKIEKVLTKINDHGKLTPNLERPKYHLESVLNKCIKVQNLAEGISSIDLNKTDSE